LTPTGKPCLNILLLNQHALGNSNSLVALTSHPARPVGEGSPTSRCSGVCSKGSVVFSETFGGFPKTFGGFPKTFGGFPKTFGGFPKTFGEFPENTVVVIIRC
jgi:hypothetical protein